MRTLCQIVFFTLLGLSGAAPSPQVLTGGLLKDGPTGSQTSDAVAKQPGVSCAAVNTKGACVSPCSWDEFGCSFSEVEEDTSMIQVVRSRKQRQTAAVEQPTTGPSESIQVVRNRKRATATAPKSQQPLTATVRLTSGGELLPEERPAVANVVRSRARTPKVVQEAAPKAPASGQVNVVRRSSKRSA